MRRIYAATILAGLLAATACGEDYTTGEPADMGAGRPITPGAEAPATEVLQQTGTGAYGADTTEAGDPSTTGTLRDTTQR